MRSLFRRVEKIEKNLNVGKEPKAPHVICLVSGDPDEGEQALPKNVEEWLTYQEQLRKCPNARLVILYAWDEAKARAAQKETVRGQEGRELSKKTD